MKIKHFLFFLCIIIVDQITKYLIRTNIILYGSKIILKNILSFTFLKNTGVSFGLFKGYNWLFLFILIVAFGYFVYLYFKEKKIQYSIICAGIIGNLIDRIFLGYVVDFINFHFWPVFNIADSAIFIGIFWLIIEEIKK